MKNNEMIEYKESFISKFRNIFKKLFSKKEEKDSYVKEKFENKGIKGQKDNFNYDIKIDPKTVDSVVEKKKFLERIDGNEEALNMLSIERLKRLEEYYDNVIQLNERKIRKIKMNI